VACLVIQCLIVESFAVAAYRCYLPVADAYARPITAEVLKDEALHLSYGEDWLRPGLLEVADAVVACSKRAVPLALAMLERLRPDLETIGMDPLALVGNFWPVSRSRCWPSASALPAPARCCAI
jgi:fatty aldehyde decarbonylase